MNENALVVWREKDGAIKAARSFVTWHYRPQQAGDCHEVGVSNGVDVVAEGEAAKRLARRVLDELLSHQAVPGVTTIHEARCACGHWERIPQTAQVFHALAERGWKIDGERIRCPRCAKKEEP